MPTRLVDEMIAAGRVVASKAAKQTRLSPFASSEPICRLPQPSGGQVELALVVNSSGHVSARLRMHLTRSRRSSSATTPMTADEAFAAAASEGLELHRAPEGKGMGKGSGSQTGYKGVIRMNKAAARPYRTQAWRGGRNQVLGYFATPEEGALAYARFLRSEETQIATTATTATTAAAPVAPAAPAAPTAPAVPVVAVAASLPAAATTALGVKRPRSPSAALPGAAGSLAGAGGRWLSQVGEGSPIEVRMEEAGLEGSRFAAHVLRVSDGSAASGAARILVRYTELLADHPVNEVDEERADDERADEGTAGRPPLLEEWVPPCRCRPAPPPPPPRFEEGLMPGDRCDLWYEDAWWDVEFVSRLPPRSGKDVTALLRVRSIQYDAYHEVDASRLRPAWSFDEATGRMTTAAI